MPENYHYLQQLVNGLTVGSTYALIAIGYTMVYGIIGMINFAHGEVYMIGSYVAFIAIAGLTMMGLDSLPLLMIAAFAGSIIIASVYGYSIERVAYRPLRGGNRLIPLISAIGMSIFLQNEVLLAQDSKDKAIPNLLPGNFVLGESAMNGVVISYMQVLIFVVTFVVMLALTAFISRSRLGRACRACAEDIKMANLLGINTNNIIALTFVIGAALAGVAAVLLGLALPILPVQILWVNMISSITLAMVLAFEPAEPSVMRRAPRPPGEPMLSGFVIWRIALVSVLFTLGIFGVYQAALGSGAPIEQARTMAVNALVAMEVFYLFSVRYLKAPSFTWQGVQGTPRVLVAVAIVMALQALFTYAPFMQTWFRTSALSVYQLMLCALAGVVVLLVLELQKAALRRRMAD